MTVKEVSDGGHRCSNCESTFKVNEVAPGLFICSGECFKIYSKHATCRNAGEGVASSKVGGGHTGNHHVEDDFGNRAVPPGDDNLKETNGGRITNGGCEPKHVEPKQREHGTWYPPLPRGLRHFSCFFSFHRGRLLQGRL